MIAPFNYPFDLILKPLTVAIAAGNVCVLKPSEMTPHCAMLMTDLVPKYIDPSAVTFVNGGVKETTVLLEQKFDHILYTGNGTVGRIVMSAAAKHLTPVILELGGKSPVFVDPALSPSDMEVVAKRVAWGKFSNCGQTCIAPDYAMVPSHLVEVRSTFPECPRRQLTILPALCQRHEQSHHRFLRPRSIDVGLVRAHHQPAAHQTRRLAY